MPKVLQKYQWDCPEAAELNLWATEFLQRQDEFAEKARVVGKPLEKLFQSIADIRHTAVHRVRISGKGIEQFILDAESLATLLDDSVCLKSLTKLRRDTRLAIEELERNKHILRSKLDETLERIAAQRAELDQLEKAAITEMLEEDGQYQVFAGTNLERAISSEVTTSASVTTALVVSENETSSREDMESVEDDGKPSLSGDRQEI